MIVHPLDAWVDANPRTRLLYDHQLTWLPRKVWSPTSVYVGMPGPHPDVRLGVAYGLPGVVTRWEVADAVFFGRLGLT